MLQFPLFSELPQELQDEIWDMAMRDPEPAAQYFVIYNDLIPRTNRITPLERRTDAARVGSDQCLLGLAADRATGSENSDQPWAVGNKSAYVTDSGLWTACRGSRARILKHLEPVGSQKTSLTMPFRRGNEERQCLTIRPMEDLLYFKLSVGSRPSLREHEIAYWRPLMEFLRFRRQRPGGGWHSPLHVRHIAVEYGPDWPVRPDGCFAEEVYAASQCGYIAGLEVCWFVNYTLRRRYQIDDESDRRGRQTFRAGDDHQFVEVLETDEEWWDPSPRRYYWTEYGKSVAHECAIELSPYCSGPAMGEQIAVWEAEDAARDAQQSNVVNNYGDNSEEDDGLVADYSVDDDHSIPWEAAAEDGALTTWDEDAERRSPRYGVLAYVKRGSERDLPTRSQWLHQQALDRIDKVDTGVH